MSLRPSLLALPLGGLLGMLTLVGCEGGVGSSASTPATTASYLTLEGFISLDQGVSDGFLRWSYLADNPSEFDDPREVCEAWEELSGVRDQSLLTADCPSCKETYRLDTTLAQTSCTGSLAEGYDAREWILGFAPIATAADKAVQDLEGQGFTHVVYSSWAPDGTTHPLEAIFVALPLVWSGGTGTAGADTATGITGEFELFSFYYWELGTDSASLP